MEERIYVLFYDHGKEGIDKQTWHAYYTEDEMEGDMDGMNVTIVQKFKVKTEVQVLGNA